jgi:hypothetical protein
MNHPNDTLPTEPGRIRCPRLGHMIDFAYCRHERGDLPCFKTLDCWHEHFSVAELLRRELTTEQWQEAFCGAVKPKLVSLMELIQAARKP